MQNWLSIHLYYDGSLDFFLINGIRPFIRKYDHQIESWFFIRYMEKGQHIRLRILPKAENYIELESKLKTTINQYFNDFFNNYPSAAKQYNQAVYPNNSIQWIDYTPEIERYGGLQGISIAEKYFCQSSNFIINAIEEESDYEQHLLMALIMNLYLVSTYSKTETTAVFQAVYENWISYNRQHLNLSKHQIINKFNTIFHQQETLIREIVALVMSEENNEDAEIEGFDVAKSDSLFINTILKKAILNKVIPSILQSYIHLNNNRLGISNFDESLIAFLILKSI